MDYCDITVEVDQRNSEDPYFRRSGPHSKRMYIKARLQPVKPHHVVGYTTNGDNVKHEPTTFGRLGLKKPVIKKGNYAENTTPINVARVSVPRRC